MMFWHYRRRIKELEAELCKANQEAREQRKYRAENASELHRLRNLEEMYNNAVMHWNGTMNAYYEYQKQVQALAVRLAHQESIIAAFSGMTSDKPMPPEPPDFSGIGGNLLGL